MTYATTRASRDHAAASTSAEIAEAAPTAASGLMRRASRCAVEPDRELSPLRVSARLGDDVGRERSRDRAIALERQLDRALGVLALDPGAIDLELDLECMNASRIFRPPLAGDIDRRVARPASSAWR